MTWITFLQVEGLLIHLFFYLRLVFFIYCPIFLLLNVANPCMRSILFKGITNLAVADCLSDQDFSGMVQRVVHYCRCSSQELESFEAWISPQLDQLLLGKFSGLVVSKLFIHGKIFYLENLIFCLI